MRSIVALVSHSATPKPSLLAITALPEAISALSPRHGPQFANEEQVRVAGGNRDTLCPNLFVCPHSIGQCVNHSGTQQWVTNNFNMFTLMWELTMQLLRRIIQREGLADPSTK